MKIKLRCMLALLAFAGALMSCSSSDEESYVTIPSTDQDNDSVAAAQITDSYRYQLPVIFHVFYHSSAQKVSASRLKAILQNVNDLWRGNVYVPGSDNSQDMGVDFVLANYDPNGKRLSEPGVEYIQIGDTVIDREAFMEKKTYKQYMWEPNDYINVMMYYFKDEDGDGITLGVSHLPYSAKGNNELEGLETVELKDNFLYSANLKYAHCVSINSRYADEESQSTRYSDAEKGLGKNGYMYSTVDVNVTLAHELGHYLGLYHVFAEKDTTNGRAVADDCIDSDFCDDTESYNYNDYVSFLKEYQDSCKRANVNPVMSRLAMRAPCEGTERYKATNFLDYAVCYSYKFTKEQRDRVRHVLYYSPLIPGPKKNGVNIPKTTGTRAGSKEMDLPMRMCE